MVCPWPCDLISSSLIFLTYEVETSCYFLSTSSLLAVRLTKVSLLWLAQQRSLFV